MAVAPTDYFSGLPEDNVLTLTTATKWDDRIFDEMKVYKISQLKEGEIADLWKAIKAEMNNSTVSKYTHHRLLALALHVGQPSPKPWKSLVTRYATGDEDLMLGLTGRVRERQGQTPAAPPPAPPALPSPDEEGISEEEKKKRKEDIDKAKTTPFVNNADDEVFGPSASGTKGDFKDIDIKYATFIGGFLMKLITKTVDNVQRSWKPANERFRGFFLESPDQIDIPNRDWLTGVKEYINHDKKGVRTLLKYIQVVESDYQDPDSNEAGICRYLFSLPLSYTGMHAYKLFLTIRSVSSKTNKFLLNALMHPKNVKALEEIALILKQFESRTSEIKPTKFRYARLIGPQYFMALQTKNCRPLVFCLVSILTHYMTSEDSLYQPGKIYGLEQLSPTVKAQMTAAASAIVGDLGEEEKLLYSKFMLDAHRSVNQPTEKAKKRAGKVTIADTPDEEIFGQ